MSKVKIEKPTPGYMHWAKIINDVETKVDLFSEELEGSVKCIAYAKGVVEMLRKSDTDEVLVPITTVAQTVEPSDEQVLEAKKYGHDCLAALVHLHSTRLKWKSRDALKVLSSLRYAEHYVKIMREHIDSLTPSKVEEKKAPYIMDLSHVKAEDAHVEQ